MMDSSRVARVLLLCWLIAAVGNYFLGRFDDWMAPQTPWQHWSKYAPSWYVSFRSSIFLLADVLPGLVAGALVAKRSIPLGALLGTLLSTTPIFAGVWLHGDPWHFGATIPDAINTVLLTTISSAAGALVRTRGVA